MVSVSGSVLPFHSLPWTGWGLNVSRSGCCLGAISGSASMGVGSRHRISLTANVMAAIGGRHADDGFQYAARSGTGAAPITSAPHPKAGTVLGQLFLDSTPFTQPQPDWVATPQNGTASERETVCQYGEISVVSVTLKKKK